MSIKQGSNSRFCSAGTTSASYSWLGSRRHGSSINLAVCKPRDSLLYSMPMQRFAAAGITFVIDLVVAITFGIFLLVVMNGYSESAATWGLGAYLVAAVAACGLSAFAAASLARVYMHRATSTFTGVFLSVSVSASVGIAALVFAGFIAVGVAEYARTQR